MASELIGTNVLARKLAALKAAPRGRALRSIVRAGIKPAEQAWQSRIPVGKVPHKTYKGRLVAPGFAKRNIRVTTYVGATKQSAGAKLGVRKEAFYILQFVERQKGRGKGRNPPTLEPSFESSQSAMLRAVAEKMKKIIQDAARK